MVTTHTDLAPTFIKLAGGELRYDFDGQVIPLHGLHVNQGEHGDIETTHSGIGASVTASAKDWLTEHINIESWGVIMSEGDHGSVLYPNHTYKALRIIGEGYIILYTVWCSGEHELYDLRRDPHEMENLYAARKEIDNAMSSSLRENSIFGSQVTLWDKSLFRSRSRSTTEELLTRLDALLMVLKTCKSRACTHPWEVLHPEGDVKRLSDAMRREYDGFYASQQKVAYEKCEKGYILESEGPMGVEPYSFDVGA